MKAKVAKRVNRLSKISAKKSSKSSSKKSIKGGKTSANITKLYLQNLCKKYTLSPNGTKKSMADRLCGLRGAYLTNTERKSILQLCSNNKNKEILKKMIAENFRQKIPKTS